MNPKRILLLIVFCLLVAGCTGPLQSTWDGLKRGAAPSAEEFRQKAIAYESQGELRQALFAYRATALLAPQDSSISENINTLERRMADMAEDHYKKGVAQFDEGNYNEAKREFLIVLRLTPDHRGAKNYLKVRIPLSDRKLYKVQRGDSFVKIATEAFNDPSKAYAIAYFNDFDPDKPLWVGTQLLLPRLSAYQILPRKEITLLLEKAKAALDQQRYETVLEITDTIKNQDPENSKILPLNDASHFALGITRMENKDYFSALEQFKQVSTGYKGRDAAIRKARHSIQRQNAEDKIGVARALYEKGDYNGAINVTEEILVQAPGNKNAKSMFEAAHYALGKKLLDQGKQAQAIDALSVLGEDYQDVSQLLSLAHAQLHASAEEYYRKGVKQFLNEELEQAIDSWKKTLALNPDHPKAQQDIDNALRLLEKWRGLDRGDKKGQ